MIFLFNAFYKIYFLKSSIVVTVVASVVNYFSLHSNNFCFSFIRHCDWISNSWQV